MNILNNILNLFTASFKIPGLEKEIKYQKAWAAYWIISYGISLAVYIRDSLGRNATYCNIAVYDILDSIFRGVWLVDVKVGESLKEKFAMGNVLKGFNFDLSSIMPDRDIEKLLGAPPDLVYDNCIKAIKSGEVRLLKPQESQEKANIGVPGMIISKELNHVAITCPNFEWNEDLNIWRLYPYIDSQGCFTGNPGWTNALMYVNDKKGFGKFDWKNLDLLYIEFRSRKTGKFLT